MAERSLLRTVENLFAGPRFSRRLALTHAVDDVADAFVNLSLAGSLFFSVSLDASRDRILLYLILTALPLAVAAPLLGPAFDRSRIGPRAAIGASQLIRAVVAVALVGSLLTLALYPLAFLVLVCRKVYTLAKTALLTQLTDDQDQFVQADAHITRTGTLAGGVGVIAAGILLSQDMTTVMLIAACILYTLSAVAARKLPSPAHEFPTASMPSLRSLVPGTVWRATLAVTATRAAAGALTYLLAFAIKGGGSDRWIFAASLLAAGGGAVLATFLAPRLLKPLEPDGVLALALLVPGVLTALGVITVGEFGVLVIAFTVGLGNGVASRSIAVLQSRVPGIARGRTIARSELLFQVATLAGAGLAVQLAPSPREGFAAVSVVLIIAGGIYSYRSRHSLRRQASRLLLGDQAPAVERTLPQALLVEAVRLASLGARRMAVVVADNAVEIALTRTSNAATEGWLELAPHVAAVKVDDEQPTDEMVIAVLDEAQRLVTASGH